MNFNYIVSKRKWADGFTETKVTKATRFFAQYDWGMIWLVLGLCIPFLITIEVILAILKCSSELMEFAMFVIMFVPILPLQILHHIAEEKLFYNKEIRKNQQLNLFRDFGLTK